MDRNTEMSEEVKKILKQNAEMTRERLKRTRLTFDLIEEDHLDMCSCSVCTSGAFDTGELYPIGKKVNRMFQLQIGGMVMYLCDECLDRLQQLIKER